MAKKMLVTCNEYTVVKCKVRSNRSDKCDNIFGLEVAANERSRELVPDSL